MANVIQTFPKGTGGGHTILDTTGTSVTDRKEIQFKGLSVTDNSTDEVTEIEGVGLNQDSLNDIASANTSNVMMGSGLVYTTTEQCIGRWVTGAPMYQKTVMFNNTAMGNNGSYAHGIANIDKVVSYEFSFDNNGTIFYGTNFIQYNSDIDVANVFKIDNTYIYAIGSNRWDANTNRTWYFTIRYTKTT